MKKIITWGIVVLLAAAGGYVFLHNKRPNPADNFKMVKASRKDMCSKVSVTGSLKPRIEITMTSAKKGQVEEILVDEGDHVKQGQTLASVSSEDKINLLNTANKNLERANLSGDAEDIAKAENELRIAEIAYQKVPIVSPIDGLVTLRNVEPGQKVETTTTILQVSDELVVKVLVDETDISKIKEGMKAAVIVDAYPDEEISGEIIKIAYTSTTESNVTSYEVLIKMPSGRIKHLKSGMTADVSIIVKEKKGVISVPVNAIKKIGNRNIVLIPGSGKMKPSPREVSTGMEDDEGIEITSGLDEGDQLLIPVSTKSPSSSKAKDMGGPPPMMMGGGPR